MEGEYAILTALGSDRIGIVDDVTTFVDELQCNIEESRMAVLGGDFAVIMLISGSNEALNALEAGQSGLGEKLNLTLQMKRTASPRALSGGRPYLIESVSLDARGIVRAVAAILKSFGVQIEDVETETTQAPWTGSPMFTLRSRVIIPRDASITSIRAALTELADKRDLDITMKPVGQLLPE